MIVHLVLSLGLSGAVLQGYLRNPLADPTVIDAMTTDAVTAARPTTQAVTPDPSMSAEQETPHVDHE